MLTRGNPPGALGRNADGSEQVTSGRPIGNQTASDGPSSELPTLDKIMAMAMCYRRLIFIWGFVPFFFLVTPVTIKISIATLFWMASGYGVTAVVCTGAMCKVWYICLDEVAPSERKRREAYIKSRYILPIIMLMFSCAFLWLLSRISSFNRGFDFRSLSSKIPWLVGLRPALGLMLLGGSLLAQFIGPFSIVRCSTVPLIPNRIVMQLKNRIETEVRIFLRKTLSFFLGQPVLAPLLPWAPLQKIGRREKYPSMLSPIALLGLSLFAAWGFAEITFLPAWTSIHSDTFDYMNTGQDRRLIVSTCVFTTMVICMKEFGRPFNSSFEINPKLYYKTLPSPGSASIPAFAINGKAMWKNACLIIVCAATTPVFSLYFWHFYWGGRVNVTLKEHWAILLFCSITSMLVWAYIALLDEAVKKSLCTPGLRLQRLVREMVAGKAPNTITLEDEEEFLLETMLHSILHGNTTMVKEVWQPTKPPDLGKQNLEKFEANRGRIASAHMANILLGLDESARHLVEATLEEDMLRHSLMESLGGDDEERHRKAIRFWIGKQNQPISYSRTIEEPRGVILVRALCAYAGGLGQALLDCCELHPPKGEWDLPPGAIVAAEYAAVAASRCITETLGLIRGASADWRSSDILMLIPVALNSFYLLHRGVVAYAAYKQKWPSAQALDMLIQQVMAKEHPELHRLLSKITSKARTTFAEFTKTAGNSLSTGVVKQALDTDTYSWLSASQDGSSSVVPLISEK